MAWCCAVVTWGSGRWITCDRVLPHVRRNCNCFADDFVRRLLRRAIPGYVNRMAYLGECYPLISWWPCPRCACVCAAAATLLTMLCCLCASSSSLFVVVPAGNATLCSPGSFLSCLLPPEMTGQAPVDAAGSGGGSGTAARGGGSVVRRGAPRAAPARRTFTGMYGHIVAAAHTCVRPLL